MKRTKGLWVLLFFAQFAHGLEKINVIDVSASNYKDQHFPSNAVDNDFSTRWTSHGDGQWIKFEFEKRFLVSKVDFAFTRGKERKYKFDIIGYDNVGREIELLKSEESDQTDELQSFSFDAAPIKSLKFVGRGNSEHLWNSIAEIEVYGQEQMVEEEVPVASVNASEEFDGHEASKAVDEDSSTYWESYGSGEFIDHYFEDPQRITEVSILFHKSKLKANSFELEGITESGNIKLGSRLTSEKVDGYQSFSINTENRLRGVRYIGFGSDVNGLNSVSEFRFVGLFPESDEGRPSGENLLRVLEERDGAMILHPEAGVVTRNNAISASHNIGYPVADVKYGDILPIDGELGCDCGSTDSRRPCVGDQIRVEYTASTINGSQSQNPIFTWNFNSSGEKAFCGRFANGDYWVAAKPGQRIEFTSISGSGESITAELDLKDPSSTGILDNSYGNHNSSKNLISQLPVVVDNSSNHLITAAIKRDEEQSGKCGTKLILGACVDAYNFLTVLKAIPDKQGVDLLRPNVASDPNNLLQMSDFNLNRLPSSSSFNAPNVTVYDEIQQNFRGVTEIFREYSEGGRAFRAHALVDDYASGFSSYWYRSLLAIMSPDYSFEVKRKALASMLTYSGDVYSIFHRQGGPQVVWGSGAGQSTGRVHPAIFFGALIDIPIITGDVAGISSYSDRKRLPQEFQQLHPSDRGPLWGDETTINRYWSGLFAGKCYAGATEPCNTKRGKKTSWDPYGQIDGPAIKPGSEYMFVTKGAFEAFASLMWLSSEFCDVTNYDDVVKYVDRLRNSGLKTANDKCAPPDPRESENCDPYRGGLNCLYYGQTWGPKPENELECVENNSGGNSGQSGRFPHLHGTQIPSGGYNIAELSSNLEQFKAGRRSCRSQISQSGILTGAVSLSGPGQYQWSRVVKLQSGELFDTSKHFGWYKVRFKLEGESKPYEFATKYNSVDLSGLGVIDNLEIYSCDYLNNCYRHD